VIDPIFGGLATSRVWHPFKALRFQFAEDRFNQLRECLAGVESVKNVARFIGTTPNIEITAFAAIVRGAVHRVLEVLQKPVLDGFDSVLLRQAIHGRRFAYRIVLEFIEWPASRRFAVSVIKLIEPTIKSQSARPHRA
jgi:hypothetical protein